METHSIIALRTLMDVKNYQENNKMLKYELYTSHKNLEQLASSIELSFCRQAERIKKEKFNQISNTDTRICDVLHCKNNISIENTDMYKIIYNTYKCFQPRYITRNQNEKEVSIICQDCNQTILKNNKSLDEINKLTEIEWKSLINNGIFKCLDYENKIEMLKTENIELKNNNVKLVNLVETILENQLDNSKIVFEIFKSSDFYNDIQKPLINLPDI